MTSLEIGCWCIDILILKEVFQKVGCRFGVYDISFKFSCEDNFLQQGTGFSTCIFYSCKKVFWYTVLQVILWISEHVIDGCLLINVYKKTILNSVLQGLSLNLIIILTASILQAFFLIQSVGCFQCSFNFAVWCFFPELSFIFTCFALEADYWMGLGSSSYWLMFFVAC